MKRTSKLYLTDVFEAIERIDDYLKDLTFEEFSRNKLVIDAVVRNFEIIGEATKHMPEGIKAENRQIQWRQMAGMRDKLVHEYFGVNIEILWKTAKNRLPALKPLIEELLKSIETEK